MHTDSLLRIASYVGSAITVIWVDALFIGTWWAAAVAAAAAIFLTGFEAGTQNRELRDIAESLKRLTAVRQPHG